MKKFKLVFIAATSLAIVFLIGYQRLKKEVPLPSKLPASTQTSEEPKVVLLKPDLKQNPIIIPTQAIEITFNLPLENVGEFKNRIDTFKDYTVKLSDDRKTAKITPNKNFELGRSYTLFILPYTKFDGHKTLGHDEHFAFRTIDYHGV